MQKIKLILINLLVLISVIFLISPKIYSETETADLNLSSTDKLVAGGKVTIVLKVENINTSSGINSIKANLTFDKEIFDSYSIETSNSWKSENSSDALSLNKSISVIGNEEVAKIVLNVKSGITATNTEIKLSNVTISGDKSSISTKGTTITFSKTDEPKIVKDGESSKVQGITNETKLPDTGKAEILSIIFITIIISIITLVLYKKIKLN